jgi:hypothetical protein
MNRIINGIAKANTVIAAKNLPADKLAAMSKNMDMEVSEYCRFQTLKSAAVGTKLTLDEANTIYGFLGNTPEHFNGQPIAVKWVLTEVFASLLKR